MQGAYTVYNSTPSLLLQLHAIAPWTAGIQKLAFQWYHQQHQHLCSAARTLHGSHSQCNRAWTSTRKYLSNYGNLINAALRWHSYQATPLKAKACSMPRDLNPARDANAGSAFSLTARAMLAALKSILTSLHLSVYKFPCETKQSCPCG